MPSIANMTVKKNDGTTDITYSYVMGASGENPALYRAPALGATAVTAPEVRIVSRQISGGKFNRVTGTAKYPYSVVNSTTGVTSLQNFLLARCELTVPIEMPQASIDEGVSQLLNCFAHSQFKSACKEGFAPT